MDIALIERFRDAPRQLEFAEVFQMSWWWVIFIVVAFAASSWFAYEGPRRVANPPEWPLNVSQIWLNFLGSAIGWAAIWFVYYRVETTGIEKFDIWDGVGVLVAFLGVTGWLPQFIIQIVHWGTPKG